MYFDDRAPGRKQVASRGFVIGPGGACHRPRIPHATSGCELFPDTRSNAASQEFDRPQHLLVGKGRDTHLKGDSRKTSENLVHVKYPLRHLFSNRDPHAMNSDSPGESEIISTRGPQLLGKFFA